MISFYLNLPHPSFIPFCILLESYDSAVFSLSLPVLPSFLLLFPFVSSCFSPFLLCANFATFIAWDGFNVGVNTLCFVSLAPLQSADNYSVMWNKHGLEKGREINVQYIICYNGRVLYCSKKKIDNSDIQFFWGFFFPFFSEEAFIFS